MRKDNQKMYFLKNYSEYERANVKLSNSTNLLCFSKLEDFELNLLSVVFQKITRVSSQLKFKDGDTVFISDEELRKFMPYTQTAYDKKYYKTNWEKALQTFCKKIVGNILLEEYIKGAKSNKYTIAVLFQEASYYFDHDDYGNWKDGLVIKLGNSASKYFLNIKSDFFNYSLAEYISLRGSYAKRLYQLLKSEEYKLKSDWTNKPWGIEFDADQFKFAMGMSNLRSYDIKRILDKTCAYLCGATDEKIGPIFYMLEWHTKKKGNKISKYCFTWTVSDKEKARAQMAIEKRKMKKLQQELWTSAKADEPIQEKEDVFDKLVDW